VENSNLSINNKAKSKLTGEEPIFNEPFTYDKAVKAPDADKWVKAMEIELNALINVHLGSNSACTW
jgi:hypothetical protein